MPALGLCPLRRDKAKDRPDSQANARKGGRSTRRRGSSLDKLTVTQTVEVRVDAPAGSRHKGYEEIVVQELEGNLIRRAWFRYFKPSDLPEPTFASKVVQSWDVATQTGDANDYSVCTMWRAERDDVYLIDAFRGRLEYPALRQKVTELAERHASTRVLIEDAGPGMNLLQDLYCSPLPNGLRPIGVKPQGVS